jgi:hypothetical protein
MRLGFEKQGQVEALRVQKMIDHNGNVFELFEGNYQPHIAVNWVTDEDGELIELVEVNR